MLLFESFKNMEDICLQYGIANYTINQDGSIDVDSNVDLSNYRLTKLPLKFGKVTGYFYCYRNQLTTLEGSPDYVGGDFICQYNNQLTTLEGSPNYVGGDFTCHDNQLTTLEGGPKEVGGDFDCGGNQLISLEGSPNEVGGDFYCGYNPIYSVFKLFPNYKSYLDSLDYGYLRGTNIVKSRFQEALEEIGKGIPEKIEGYNYI